MRRAGDKCDEILVDSLVRIVFTTKERAVAPGSNSKSKISPCFRASRFVLDVKGLCVPTEEYTNVDCHSPHQSLDDDTHSKCCHLVTSFYLWSLNDHFLKLLLSDHK